jgi:superfamily II DNA or RNA helicase
VLRELDLLPVYDSAEADLMDDLIVPLLRQSQEYWRGVGFFTSGWLRIAAMGLVSFIESGGHARIILSPILQEADWRALQLGEEARRDECLKSVLRRNLEEIKVALERETLNCLAWLIADEVLEFRFAIPRPHVAGDYHDKVGVFTDSADDTVAIHGSFNDSVQGTLNGEAFSVFKSWDPGHAAFVNQHRRRLLSLWNGDNAQFTACGIPDAIRDAIIHLRTSDSRPYSLPSSWEEACAPDGPRCPVTLREFQEAAISEWEKAHYRGIFEMATGTGKTYTALACAARRFAETGKLAAVVLVPYVHLVEQWARDCRKFGFVPVLCSSAHPGWRHEAKSVLRGFRTGLSHACLLAVHNTAATTDFAQLTAHIPESQCMLVADEVHGLGAGKLRAALLPRATMRLGLSATPRRWFDEDGTRVLMDYFNGVCFEYSLRQAIGTFLVPYQYHPLLTSLTDEEEARFADLTGRIDSLRNQAEEDPEIEEAIKRLLIERARIVGAAANKLPLLLTLLSGMRDQIRQRGDDLKHILIYCAPGAHQRVLQEVSALGIRCHEFVHTVTLTQRSEVLQHFANGDIQVLVAIKCLDEGVDVPSTRTAFFMASTTNPREFVQRRGRILRLSPGKKRATVFDFVVTPGSGTPDDIARLLLRRELPRFVECAAAASNEFEARSLIREILDRYEMLNLLDEYPWDLYLEQRRASDE